MKDPGRVVIIGAGPTGLGAACQFVQAGFDDFVVVEGSGHPGGLASSVVDAQGFTWDIGGHVQFSHYADYDRVLDRALGDGWLTHRRSAWIWIRGRFVPYPLQYNLHHLDPADRRDALEGLGEAARVAALDAAGPATTFDAWIERSFGAGLARLFFEPYNRKVWAYPLHRLDTAWLGDRVAMPDLERVLRNAAEQTDDDTWGPNQSFRYPLRGGTGAIWQAIAGWLPPDKLWLGTQLSGLSLASRTIALHDGRSLPYGALVATLPIDRLCRLCGDLPSAAAPIASQFIHSSTHVVGVGVEGIVPPPLATKSWIYFPEDHSPYYRVTVLSNYSPHNVPAAGHWSLLAEVSASPHRPIAQEGVSRRVVESLRADGLLPADARIVSLWSHTAEHGYPTPFVGRWQALRYLREVFEAAGVYPRGRFGSWIYEISNQDHCFMQGVEVARRLLGLGSEATLERPGETNDGRYRQSAVESAPTSQVRS